MDLFTGKEPHDISLEIALAWIENYEVKNPGQINGLYFGGAAISAILSQTGCVGNRFYYALNDVGLKELIAVGVKASQNDMYEGLLAVNTVNGQQEDISLEAASARTKNYRDNNPDQIIGHYFGGDAISAILAQTGCVGVRIKYALNDEGIKQLIVVGVDAFHKDMINGILAERSINCPPTCGIENPLNSDI